MQNAADAQAADRGAEPGGLRRHGAAMALMVIGVACLCVNDALAKGLGAEYPVFQILFLRNLIAAPFTVLIALRMGGRAALRSHRPLAHLLRGALWVGAAWLFFTSIGRMGLAEATALVFVAPLFITALSALFFGEKVGRWRWSAVAAGFVGVLIVIRPGAETFQPIALLPVATALVYAALMLGARLLDPRESVWTLLLWLTGMGGAISALIAPFVWVPVAAADLPLFFAFALFGTAGMTMMTQAFRSAPASLIAPLDYTALIWAAGLGWIFWGEIPDAAAWLGAAIIIAGGALVIWREARAERPAPPAMPPIAPPP